MTARFFEYGSKETDWLARRDKRMAQAIAHFGILRRGMMPDLFAALVRNIVDQQISTKAGLTVNARLLALAGSVTPQRLEALPAQAIQGCGMSMKKALYIKGAASAAMSGELDLSAIHQASDEQVIATLSRLPGIGVWTAEMLMIFSRGRPDVLSWGDLAIRRGMMHLYRHKTLPAGSIRAVSPPLRPLWQHRVVLSVGHVYAGLCGGAGGSQTRGVLNFAGAGARSWPRGVLSSMNATPIRGPGCRDSGLCRRRRRLSARRTSFSMQSWPG